VILFRHVNDERFELGNLLVRQLGVFVAFTHGLDTVFGQLVGDQEFFRKTEVVADGQTRANEGNCMWDAMRCKCCS
jgi:hypothetical protein